MEYTQESPLRLIELFAGIGSQTQALKNVGVPHTVVAISEIDKNAIKSYTALHGETANLGDIREIGELPEADFGHIRSHAKTSRWRGMVRASRRGRGAGCCLKSSGC